MSALPTMPNVIKHLAEQRVKADRPNTTARMRLAYVSAMLAQQD